MLLGRLYRPRLALALGYPKGPRRAFPDATNTTQATNAQPPHTSYENPTLLLKLRCLRDQPALSYDVLCFVLSKT